MSDRIRWGILGTGKIAHQFAAALRRLPDLVVQIRKLQEELHARWDCRIYRR